MSRLLVGHVEVHKSEEIGHVYIFRGRVLKKRQKFCLVYSCDERICEHHQIPLQNQFAHLYILQIIVMTCNKITIQKILSDHQDEAKLNVPFHILKAIALVKSKSITRPKLSVVAANAEDDKEASGERIMLLPRLS